MVLQAILIINVAALTVRHDYLIIKIIEQVFKNNQFSIEDLLWEREKYWQAQLFTNLYEMNNIHELCSMKRKGYRK